MKNNHMRFGDIVALQHKGIAMGMLPAPLIANLFVAIYKNTHLLSPHPPGLFFLRRFIDDGFGIWLRHPDKQQDDANWSSFQHIVNAMGLTWEFSQQKHSDTFMDLNITLADGTFSTNLYAKPLALHLYIPPISCHAPGIFTGLIQGQFH